MTIKVVYLPAGETSPLPKGNKEHTFLSYLVFKEWVIQYVCIHCLKDFEEFYGKQPKTLGDWLAMGCGAEIYIEDLDKLIYWDDVVK